MKVFDALFFLPFVLGAHMLDLVFDPSPHFFFKRRFGFILRDVRDLLQSSFNHRSVSWQALHN